jgi:hypothetical protein
MSVNIATLMSGQQGAVTGKRWRPEQAPLQLATLEKVESDLELGRQASEQVQRTAELEALERRHGETLESQKEINLRTLAADKEQREARLAQERKIAKQNQELAQAELDRSMEEAKKARTISTISTGLQAVNTVSQLVQGSSIGSTISRVLSSIPVIGKWFG